MGLTQVWNDGNLVTAAYNLELWQVRAIQAQKLTAILVPGREVENLHAEYNSGLLLCLREPFYYEGGGHGEQGSFYYEADDPKLKEGEWSPADFMHPCHVRFFMTKMCLPIRPDTPAEARIYFSALGFSHNPEKGVKLTDRVQKWWKKRYGREYKNEDSITVLDGQIVK
jgi:hypothetical protein